MKDSVGKSLTMGRLLGSLIMGILGTYLAAKGIDLSESDKETGAMLIEAAALAFTGAVPGVVSKIRERRKDHGT